MHAVIFLASSESYHKERKENTMNFMAGLYFDNACDNIIGGMVPTNDTKLISTFLGSKFSRNDQDSDTSERSL